MAKRIKLKEFIRSYTCQGDEKLIAAFWLPIEGWRGGVIRYVLVDIRSGSIRVEDTPQNVTNGNYSDSWPPCPSGDRTVVIEAGEVVDFRYKASQPKVSIDGKEQ